MSAVVAIDQYVSHTGLGLRVQLSHASVLPGVFDGVCKYNLITCDVSAAVVRVVPVNNGRASVVVENIFAPLEPKVGTKEVRSHGLDGVGDLEPAELGADLPRPLSRVVIDVIGDVLEDVSVVRTDISIALDCELIENWELLLNWSGGDAVEDVAHLLSASVLNGSCNCVSNVVHKISRRKVSATEYLIHVVLVIRSELSSD